MRKVELKAIYLVLCAAASLVLACALLTGGREAARTPTAGPELPPRLSDQQGAEMVLVPAGEFQMGKPGLGLEAKPVHTVYLDAFYIDVTEVTNALYARCVEAGACSPPDSGASLTENHYGQLEFAAYPVVFVNWQQAQDYCQWRGGRLPTEAEWEKAARGGLEGKLFPWGDEDPVCDAGAVNGAQSGRCPPRGPWPVGSFAPNGYGLYDMAGNAIEWLSDWFEPGYYRDSPERNPAGPASGTRKVVRYGAWYYTEIRMTLASRSGESPGAVGPELGFRCAAAP